MDSDCIPASSSTISEESDPLPFLFDPEVSSSPEAVLIDQLTHQFQFFKRRKLRKEAEETALQLLQATHCPTQVTSALEKLNHIYYPHTPLLGDAVDDCVWKALTDLQERLPGSNESIDLITQYSRFVSMGRRSEASRQRLATVWEWLSPRANMTLSREIQGLPAVLLAEPGDGMAVLLEHTSILLKSIPTFATNAHLLAYWNIAKLHAAHFPSQLRETERLIKWAVIQAKSPGDQRWCLLTYHSIMSGKNYESTEAAEVFFMGKYRLHQTSEVSSSFLLLRNHYMNR